MLKLAIRHSRGSELVQDDELPAMIASENPNVAGFALLLRAKNRVFGDDARLLRRPIRIQNMHLFGEWQLAATQSKNSIENEIFASMYLPSADPELTGAAVTLMAIMLTLTGQSKMRTTPDLEMRDKIRKFLSAPIGGGGAMSKIRDAFDSFKNMIAQAFNAMKLVRFLGEQFLSILNSFFGFIAQLTENATSGNNCIIDTIAMFCSFSVALDVAKPFIGVGLPSIASILTASGIVYGRQGMQPLSIIFHALTVVMWGAGNFLLGAPTPAAAPFLAIYCIAKLLFGDFTWSEVREYFKRKGDEFKEAIINWLKQSLGAIIAVKNKLTNTFKRAFSNAPPAVEREPVDESKADDEPVENLDVLQGIENLRKELNLDGCRNPAITRPIKEILDKMLELHFELKGDYEDRGEQIEKLKENARKLLEKIEITEKNYEEKLRALENQQQQEISAIETEFYKQLAEERAKNLLVQSTLRDDFETKQQEMQAQVAAMKSEFERKEEELKTQHIEEMKSLKTQHIEEMKSFEALNATKFAEEQSKRETLAFEHKETRLSRDVSLLLVFALQTWTTRLLFAHAHFSIETDGKLTDFIVNLEKTNKDVMQTLLKLIKTTDERELIDVVVPRLDALLQTFPEWIDYRKKNFQHVLTLDELKLEDAEKGTSVAHMIAGSLLSVAPVILPTIIRYHDPVPLLETALHAALGTGIAPMWSAAQLAWLTQNAATVTAGVCTVINGYKRLEETRLAARIRVLTTQDYESTPRVQQPRLTDHSSAPGLTHTPGEPSAGAGIGANVEGGQAFSNNIFEIMYDRLIEFAERNEILDHVKKLEKEVDNAIDGNAKSLIDLKIVEGKLIDGRRGGWISSISSLFRK